MLAFTTYITTYIVPYFVKTGTPTIKMAKKAINC